jgi:Flp pilus assembly protein TadB
MGTDDGIDDGPDGAGRATEPEGTDELARLRHERDEMVARLSRVEHRGARRRRLRAVAVAVLVALALVLLDLSFVGLLVLAAVVGLFVLALHPAADDVEGT